MSFRIVLTLLLLATASLVQAQGERPFDTEVITRFDEPWAIAFLPDGRLLVTEKKGRLLVVTDEGQKTPVSGVPDVDYGGQGGLGDVALHPDFADNGMIYLSYVEAGVDDTRGAAVARGRLDLDGRRPALTDMEVIWRQYPKFVGYGHYGHRLLFDDGGHLWITSGDRQKFTPSQDMQSNAGKVLRLNDDGSVPSDNPYVGYFSKVDPLVDDIGVYEQVWSLGHRNPLGIDTDLEGRLWVIEMGPKGGDEINLIQRGGNYGYPLVSNGEHYDGRPIPDHETRPEFLAPKAWWTPVISPGDLHVVRGDGFTAWRGDALAAGLSSRAIVRIALDGDSAREVERYDMGARIRAITEGPDGALWVLEDERGDSEGRLLKLTPRG
jgi:glucose/arabinose dehydrogenase